MATNAPKDNLLPIGASPEDQAAQSEAWTAAVAYAALLHDIGKIAVDLHVELADGSTWHPWHGRCTRRTATVTTANTACTASQQACSIANCSTATSWTGSATIRLSGAPLLYVQAGQYEHAGVLGELVVQADRTSVAQELGGDPARAMAAPKHALLDGLHYLLKEQLKLNQPEASDGWLTEDGLWLVSKTVFGQTARTPPVSGDRWHSCEQHRRVQRAARPRHAPAHLGRQSGLARDRDQHDRLVPFVHPVASRSRADLGVWRATSTFRGHGRDRRDARGKRRQHVGSRAYRLGEPSAGRSRASDLGGRQHHHRFTARSPARARRHGGFARDGGLG